MNELEIEIFRAGDYGEKGTYNEKEISQIAEDYDPAVHEAPVTIDHAQSGPAFGWVEKVYKNGNMLIARLRNLNEKFVDLVKNGSFKKRSIELYKKLEATGRPYLRALSFLGAKPPEVKGLADITFSEPAEFISLDFSEGNSQIDYTDIKNTIESLLEEKKRVEERLHNFEQEKKREEIHSFCERLKSKGIFLPAWEEMGIITFMENLNETEIFEFSEETKETPLNWFKRFIESLPQIIPMGESVTNDKVVRTVISGIPTGTEKLPVSPESIEIHNRVIAFQEANKGVSYVDALKAVAR